MYKETPIQRSTTIPRRQYNVPDSSDDSSSIISTQTSDTESSNNSAVKKSKVGSGVTKDTYASEVSRSKKNNSGHIHNKDMSKLGTDSISADKQKLSEFMESLPHDKGSKKSKRERVEDFIRTNASDAFMRQMTEIADHEIRKLKGEKVKKWVAVSLSGAANQFLSFGLASELAIYTKQAWLFTVIAPLLSELFSEKVAAQIRRTTYMTDDTKNLQRKQRLIARAVGDLIRQAGGLQPKAKYNTNNPALKGQKFTAWGALTKDTDRFLAISANNFVNRGLPFLCFTGTYIGREFLLKLALKGAPGWEHLLLRLSFGLVAGSLTALTNQFITSRNKDAKEVPGHSTSYWHAKENYLQSIRQDIRQRLNELGKMPDKNLKEAVENVLLDLDKKIEREQRIAKLKKSALTTIPGDIRASMHHSRPEDSLDPEAPGTRAQTVHNILGKMISLVYFTYMFDQALKNENGAESFSNFSALNLVFLPFALILTGYMWKDDTPIASRIFGATGKAVRDTTAGRETYNRKNASSANDVVTLIDQRVINNGNGSVNDNDNDHRQKDKSENLSSIEIDDANEDYENNRGKSENQYRTEGIFAAAGDDSETSYDESGDNTKSSSNDIINTTESSTSSTSRTSEKIRLTSSSTSSETQSYSTRGNRRDE